MRVVKTETSTDVETTPLLEGGTASGFRKRRSEDINRNEVSEPSRTRKIVVLVCCGILHLLSGGTGYALGVIYVELIRVFNSPRTDAALVQSVYMGIMTAGGLLFTGLITRFGTGPCIAVGSMVACLGFIISSFAENVPMIIAFTGVIAGFGMSVCYLCAFITVSWLFHSGAGAPLVLLTVGNGIGQIIFPYIYDTLITEYGWRGTFLLIGAITLHCVPIGVLFFTSRRFYKVERDTDNGKRTKTFDLTLLKDPVIILFLSNALLFSCTGNIEMWFIVDIMVIRGYTRDVGSVIVSVAGVGNCIGRIGGGFLRYYVKFPAVYHWVYAVAIVAGCHAMVIYRSDYWSIFGSMLVYGVFFGMVASLSPAIMLEAAGLARYPRAVAMMNLCNGIGNMVGGLFGGFINDATGSYDLMFLIAITLAAYITLSSILISYCMTRRRTRDYQEIKPSVFQGEEELVSKQCHNGMKH